MLMSRRSSRSVPPAVVPPPRPRVLPPHTRLRLEEAARADPRQADRERRRAATDRAAQFAAGRAHRFVAVTIPVFGQRSRRRPSDSAQRTRRHTEVVLVACMGVLISVAVWVALLS